MRFPKLHLMQCLFVLLLCSQMCVRTSLDAQERTITPKGDTVIVQKRHALWRGGVFAQGAWGADIGNLNLATDLNRTLVQELYQSAGIGAGFGYSVGVQGAYSLSPEWDIAAGIGFMQRRGQFTFVPQNPDSALYQVHSAETVLQGLSAELSAECKLGSGLQAYGGANVMFPMLAAVRTQFRQTRLSPNPIGDLTPVSNLAVQNPILGVHIGINYRWRVRETATTRLVLVPFCDVQWQPNIYNGQASSWSAVMVRFGTSFSIAPVFTDTLETRLFVPPKDTLAEQDSIRRALARQRRLNTDASVLPVSGMNDSLLAEQTFTYPAVYSVPSQNVRNAPDSTSSGAARFSIEMLPKTKEFIQEILPDAGSETRFRLTITTLAEERSLAEQRLESVRVYLQTQNIAVSRIESRITERNVMDGGQRLRIQIFR